MSDGLQSYIFGRRIVSLFEFTVYMVFEVCRLIFIRTKVNFLKSWLFILDVVELSLLFDCLYLRVVLLRACSER